VPVSSPAADTSSTRPLPLLLAAMVAAVQGAVLVVYAVLEAFSVTGGRAAMGVTTALFFAAAGAVLAVCGVAVLRRMSWGRSPLVLAQLIALGLAWSFRGGATTWVAVALGAAALVVLVGLLHPRSLAWLAPG
jgi:uncharacterized membrane protein YeiH